MITIDPIKRPSKVSSSVNTEDIMKEVDQRIANALDGSIEIPLEFVTKSELEAKGYLTSHQDISHLATQNQLSSIDTELSELGLKVDGLEGSLNGVVDLNIVDTLTWTKGVWHYENNGDYGSPFMRQTYRYSNKIDISDYDSVKLSGLWNGGPSSTKGNTLPTVTIFGNGKPIEWQMYQDGEEFELLRSTFIHFDKVEIVVTARQSEDVYVPSIKVTQLKGLKAQTKDLTSLVKTLNQDMYNVQKVVTGVFDENIANTIYWTKGCWHFTTNQGGGSQFMKDTYRYSNKIDISDYDKIVLSGLWNGGPSSTNESVYPTLSILGNDEPIKFVQIEIGAQYTMYRVDYQDYDKLEIIINTFQSEETHIPSILVTKYSAFDSQSTPKRIVVCGDSLFGNDSALIKKQLTSIAKAMGYEIILNAMGGENIIGNLTRNGGIGIRVTSDFVMPTSGSVDIEVESAWMKSDGTYAQNPYNNATNRDVRIMGIKGKLTRNNTTSYTFTRNDEGESFNVGIGTLLWDETLWSCKDYPHIWFTGQNMGYENEQDWADMINMAARNFGENFIVCSTALSGTTNQLVRCGTKTFGDKYVNLKAYTEGQAVYDGQRFGLIDSSTSASDYASLFWPGSDKVHQNNLLSYMWAVLMWNTLLDLGYVEGDRIESGEYYLQ